MLISHTDEHYNIDIYDASEWAAEAIGHIGLVDAYTFGVAEIEIEGYKASLPFGCENILGVRDALTGARINKSTDQFFLNPSVSSANSSGDAYDFPAIEDSAAITMELSYYINGGYIYTNFKEGTIEIAYTSYPLDERGLPMIPDEINYKKAVMSYIRYIMDYRLWRKGKLTQQIKNDSEAEWAHYCSAAFVKNNLNIDDIENLFKGMVKIASDQNAHDYSFKFLNRRNVTKY